jgi:DNA modification methylase
MALDDTRRPAVAEPYYQDDSVTLYHGDCREIDLPARSVDLLIADPPYGINWKSRGQHERIHGDRDNEWVKEAMRHNLKALRIHRHFYVFGPDVVSDLTVCPSVELIWDKGRMGASGSADIPWSPGHERITFAMYSPFKSHRNTGAGAVRLRRSSVLKIPKQNNGRGSLTHPNEKPVELIRVMVEASSQFDETVFDPFAGSGSTLVAALLEGRKAIGIEMDEKYCEVIATRAQEARRG